MHPSYIRALAAVEKKLTGEQLRAVAIILRKLTGDHDTPRHHYVTAETAGIMCRMSRRRARVVLNAMQRKGLLRCQVGAGPNPDMYTLHAFARATLEPKKAR